MSPFVPELSHRIILVAGPTASGKSSLAQALAERIRGEVVSADSMQIYQGMDIGTGKVPAHERRVPHWGLDLVEPGEPYSVARYQDYARRVIADIDGRGKRAILCGGTGFYLRSVIDGYDFPQGEQRGNTVRDSYTELLGQIGEQELWEHLREADPASAALIHPRNSKRVIRAFELLAQGESYASQKERLQNLPQVLAATYLALNVARDVLYERIGQRVDAMFADGLVEEVERLLAGGFRTAITAPQAIGYKEVVAALDGSCSMDEARESIKQATRRYAKRQLSWLRADKRVLWLDATDASPAGCSRLLESALDAVQ